VLGWFDNPTNPLKSWRYMFIQAQVLFPQYFDSIQSFGNRAGKPIVIIEWLIF
jgi:hypothetical protein